MVDPYCQQASSSNISFTETLESMSVKSIPGKLYATIHSSLMLLIGQQSVITHNIVLPVFSGIDN